MIASAAVAAAILAIAVVVYVAAENRLVAQVDQSLTNRATTARAVGGIVEALGRTPLNASPFRDPRGFDVLYAQVVDGSGAVTTAAGQTLQLPVPPDQPESRRSVFFTEATVDDIHLRIANLPLGDAGVLQIARSLEEVDSTLASLALTLALVGLLGVGGAALLGRYVASSSLRPIAQLTAAAEEVARTKELGQRLDLARDDELGRLAASFDEMLEALRTSKEQQRQLVRDAGHELRTPLTALRTNIELLAKAKDLPTAEREAIQNDLEAEMAQLTDLVNEVVEVAADPDVAEDVAVLDLGAVADHVVRRFQRRIVQPLHIEVAEPATIQAQRTRLERAIANLIDNAAKWSPPESPIAVSVDGGSVRVTDRGTGIAAADLPHIFDRFYRAPAARSQPGSGLGLAIVKQVVEDLGGAVVAESAAQQTTVGFDLPSAEAFSESS